MALLSVENAKTAFEQVRRHRRRSEPIQLGAIRWEALDRFLKLGFPTTTDEGWQLTDVTPIAERIFTMAAAPAAVADAVRLAPFHAPDLFGAELVFVNGHYVPEASSAPTSSSGALVEPLSAVLDEHPEYIDTWLTHIAPLHCPAFVALNTAVFVDGACILVPADTIVEKPIHVRFISTGEADMRPAMSHPRVLVLLEARSRATIVESHAGADGEEYFTDAVTEIAIGEEADLEFYRLQHEGRRAFVIGGVYSAAARDARASLHSVSLGGALVRQDVVAALGGEGGEYTVNGLYVADGHQLVDHHTVVEHVAPRCRSDQRCRGLLAEDARGVVDARVIVGRDAPATDARHMNESLLLSDEARIDSTSRIDRSAHDVDLAEHSVVRRLGTEAAAYARAHGVEPAEALEVVAHAFASMMVNSLRLPELRPSVQGIVRQRLNRLLGAER